MASVTLATVWLSDAADHSDAQAFPDMAKLAVGLSVPGEVRRYVNGRLRTITKAGQARSVSLSLPACDRTQVAWLEDHAGRTVLVRDDRGRKVWGVYLAVPVEEHQYNDEADVELSLAEVTYDEAI